MAAVESRFQALHDGECTCLVGREEELSLVLRRWTRAKAGAGRVVHIIGEPGIGKSRLVHELRMRLADEPHRASDLYCSPLHQDSAYYPFVHQLERAANVGPSANAADRLARIETLLGENGTPETITLIADLLSLPTGGGQYPPLDLSPRQRRERTAEALIAHLLGAPGRVPVLLVFEDLHWIDPSSREVLELLLERIRERPILVIVTSRTGFVPAWPGLIQAESLVLNRLDDCAVAEMVAEVGGGTLAVEHCRRIVERADGVPLFAEELTKMVLESGLVRATVNDMPNGLAPDLALPTRLHDLLMARLDWMPAAKEVAQVGAVIGRSFSHAWIAALASRSELDMCQAVDQLVTSRLVSRRGTPPDATYTFRHALVQSAAYESLLKSRRTAVHARIVTLIETSHAEHIVEHIDTLAYHAMRGELWLQAMGYSRHAAQKAAELSAYAEAATHFEQSLAALEHLPPSPELTAQAIDLARRHKERANEAWAQFALSEVELADEEDGASRAKAGLAQALSLATSCRMEPLAARCRQALLSLDH